MNPTQVKSDLFHEAISVATVGSSFSEVRLHEFFSNSFDPYREDVPSLHRQKAYLRLWSHTEQGCIIPIIVCMSWESSSTSLSMVAFSRNGHVKSKELFEHLVRQGIESPGTVPGTQQMLSKYCFFFFKLKKELLQSG